MICAPAAARRDLSDEWVCASAGAGNVAASPPADFKMTNHAESGAMLEFEEGASHAPRRVAFVADEQVVHVDHGAVLHERLDELEDRRGRFVEVAVDVHERDPALFGDKALAGRPP